MSDSDENSGATASAVPSPDGMAIMREFVSHSPFVGHLGIRIDALEPDEARLVLPFAESLVTVGDLVHGGAISALADTAAMAASWSTGSPPANLRGTTVGLSIDFLAGARASDLVATARVLRRGSSLCFCDVDVHDDDGMLVAKSLVTYKLG